MEINNKKGHNKKTWAKSFQKKPSVPQKNHWSTRNNSSNVSAILNPQNLEQECKYISEAREKIKKCDIHRKKYILYPKKPQHKQCYCNTIKIKPSLITIPKSCELELDLDDIKSPQISSRFSQSTYRKYEPQMSKIPETGSEYYTCDPSRPQLGAGDSYISSETILKNSIDQEILNQRKKCPKHFDPMGYNIYPGTPIKGGKNDVKITYHNQNFGAQSSIYGSTIQNMAPNMTKMVMNEKGSCNEGQKVAKDEENKPLKLKKTKKKRSKKGAAKKAPSSTSCASRKTDCHSKNENCSQKHDCCKNVMPETCHNILSAPSGGIEPHTPLKQPPKKSKKAKKPKTSSSDFDQNKTSNLHKFRTENYFETHATENFQKPIPDHRCVHKFTIDSRLYPNPTNADPYGISRCIYCNQPMKTQKTIFVDQRINSRIPKPVNIGDKKSIFEISFDGLSPEVLKRIKKQRNTMYCNTNALRFQKLVY